MKKLALAMAVALAAGVAHAQDKTIKIAGFGAKSGVVRSFGINSEAALLAAADVVNKAGGVKLADGSKAKIAIEFYDDRCDAGEGISVIRRIASTDAVVAVAQDRAAYGARARARVLSHLSLEAWMARHRAVLNPTR